MTEREFWILVRQALLLMVSTIERRYLIGKHAPAQVVPLTSQEVESIAASLGGTVASSG